METLEEASLNTEGKITYTYVLLSQGDTWEYHEDVMEEIGAQVLVERHVKKYKSFGGEACEKRGMWKSTKGE